MMAQTTDAEREAARQAQIAKYEADMRSGAQFARGAASARSYIGYRAPTSSKQFADLVTRLAALVPYNDEAAQIVHKILTKLHIYGCYEELQAKAYDAAFEAVKAQYTDVIALASPEPPRRSRATRPYHLLTLLDVYKAIAGDGEGWCASALREAIMRGEIRS